VISLHTTIRGTFGFVVSAAVLFMLMSSACDGAPRVVKSLDAGRGPGNREPPRSRRGLNVLWRWRQPEVLFQNVRFSPDGRELAFERDGCAAGESHRSTPEGDPAGMRANPPPAEDNVFVARVGSPQLEAIGEGHRPAWSPDGKRLSFLRRARPLYPPTYEVALYDRPLQRARRLLRTGDDAAPSFAFAPRGDKLLCLLDPGGIDPPKVEVVSVALDSGVVTTLLSARDREGWIDQPRWVHDRWLVLWEPQVGSHYELVDLSAGRRVLHAWDWEQPWDVPKPKPWFAPAENGSVILSHGAEWIVVNLTTARGRRSEAPPWVRVERPRTPEPSPDGTRVAVNDSVKLTVLALPGGAEIAHWEASAQSDPGIDSVTWSPQSDRLAAVIQHCPDPHTKYRGSSVRPRAPSYGELVVFAAP